MSMYQILAVFVYGVLIDLLYVVWIHCVSVDRKHLASFSTVGIAACGIFGTLGVIDNRWLAIPYLFGIYCGTLLGMKAKQYITEKVK